MKFNKETIEAKTTPASTALNKCRSIAICVPVAHFYFKFEANFLDIEKGFLLSK